MWDTVSKHVNLTWERGNNSDTDVVIRKNGTSYPVNPFDGYEVYNGTLGWFNESAETNRAYTVFSYNETTQSWSEGLNIPWGAMGIWVYNASKTWQQVEPYGIKIQNQEGTQTYVNISNTPLYLDLNDIPIGVNTIFIINSSEYKTQTYTRDTSFNAFYNYSFMLPPITTPGGESSDENDTYLYLITVINDLNQAVPDALVTINIYKNDTDSYELVFSFLTDGAGQASCWLMPNQLYQVIITKDGYNQMLTYWTPSHLIFTKTFQITTEDIIPQPPIIAPEEIHFTAVLINGDTQIQVDYLDDSGYTNYTILDVSVFNYSSLSWQHLGTYTNTSLQTWTMIFNNINRSNDYYFNLTYNNQYLGTAYIQLVIEAEKTTPTDTTEFDTRFSWMGVIPFGAYNFLSWLFLIGICYYTDSRDAGKIIMVFGVICLFLGTYIGLTSPLTIAGGAAGGGLAVLFIILGVLMEWNTSKKKA